MKLAIIVPYRNRLEHLNEFIPHMNDYLKKQNIQNSIFIIEQEDEKPFNRGKLLNIGFDLAEKHSDYFCFHDVDMLPVEANYSMVKTPTHIATKVEQFNFSIPYYEYFGGVTLFDKYSFKKINGYSNEFWGWGAEDDDLRNRCLNENIQISRRNCTFSSLYHTPNGDTNGGVPTQETLKNRERFYSLKNNKDYYKQEGLNSLTYSIISEEKKDNHNHIKVKV